MLLPKPEQSLPFFSVQVTPIHSRIQCSHQLLWSTLFWRPPWNTLPSFAPIKAFIHPQCNCSFIYFLQETVSSRRQELWLICLWLPCALPEAWLVYVCWLNKQEPEENCPSATLNSKNQIALWGGGGSGHRVNLRVVPSPGHRPERPILQTLLPATVAGLLGNGPKRWAHPSSPTE